eukprot:1123546-Rhodomonas_salina.4
MPQKSSRTTSNDKGKSLPKPQHADSRQHGVTSDEWDTRGTMRDHSSVQEGENVSPSHRPGVATHTLLFT